MLSLGLQLGLGLLVAVAIVAFGTGLFVRPRIDALVLLLDRQEQIEETTTLKLF